MTEPAPDQWDLTGRVCLGGAAAGGAGVPVVSAREFQQLPLPAGRVHVQPASGRTLVNVPANVYVDAQPVIVPAVVVGRQVQVRATPVTYRWSFGDGATLETTDPGAPYPDLRVTHTYTQAGTWSLVLTTTYRGEYSVGGGPWLPVDGVATVTSPAQVVTAVATRAQLVAGTAPG